MLDDVTAAIPVVASDDTVFEFNQEVLQSFWLWHPPELEDSMAPTIPAHNIAMPEDQIKMLRSFRSFSGGIDGLQPAHLLHLVSYSTAEAGLRLL